MKTVVASTNNRDFGSVDVWLSGLRHSGANGTIERSVRSNRTASANFSITSTRNAAWSACLPWKEEVVRSNRTVSTNHGRFSGFRGAGLANKVRLKPLSEFESRIVQIWLSSRGSPGTCLKNKTSRGSTAGSQIRPIISIEENPADNRETVERNHDWVPSLLRLAVRQLAYNELSGRSPQDSGSNPLASIIGCLRTDPQAVCKTVVSRQSWFNSNTTDQFSSLHLEATSKAA